MAELALGGTIIGLVATGAHLAVKVANFLQAVEDAPESIQDVRSELQGVNNILEQIKTPIKSQPDSIPPGTLTDVAKNAKDCTRVFTQLNKLIDRLGRPNSKRQKFLFVFYADNIIAARSSLQAQKLSLSLTLQLALRPLVVQQETSNTPTHSQEVARSLISTTAASLQMPPILPLPPAAALPIEPESQPPPDYVATVDTTKEAHDARSEADLEPYPRVDPHPQAEAEDSESNREAETDTETETEDGRALILVSDRGDLEMAELLLEFNVNPNATGLFHGCALQAAAFSGHTAVIELLIAKGAKVNLTGHRWGSPLGAAVSGNKPDAVKLLLEKGADPDMGAVLVQAAAQGDTKSVRSLLDHGADVEVRGGFHGSPLQAAAFGGHLEVVKLLLARGADGEATGHRWGQSSSSRRADGPQRYCPRADGASEAVEDIKWVRSARTAVWVPSLERAHGMYQADICGNAPYISLYCLSFVK